MAFAILLAGLIPFMRGLADFLCACKPLSQEKTVILSVVNDILVFDTIILFLYLKYQP